MPTPPCPRPHARAPMPAPPCPRPHARAHARAHARVRLRAADLGVFMSWLVLAAALEPTRFLPYGVAVVALFLVGLTVGKQLSTAAETLKLKLRQAFEAMMQSKLRAAMRRMSSVMRLKQKERRAMEYAQREGTAVEGSADAESEEDEDDEEAPLNADGTEKEITPAEVFAMINEDGSDTLSMDEFLHFFKLLELDVSENQLEQLYAFCDVDCSGAITEQECLAYLPTSLLPPQPLPLLHHRAGVSGLLAYLPPPPNLCLYSPHPLASRRPWGPLLPTMAGVRQWLPQTRRGLPRAGGGRRGRLARPDLGDGLRAVRDARPTPRLRPPHPQGVEQRWARAEMLSACVRQRAHVGGVGGVVGILREPNVHECIATWWCSCHECIATWWCSWRASVHARARGCGGAREGTAVPERLAARERTMGRAPRCPRLAMGPSCRPL